LKKKIRYDHPQPGATDPTQCNGCGVCMLSCPVWHQHHTKALTYCGRTRALIGGADEEDLAPAARGCILCGSCEPLCPMGIRTQQATIRLRKNLSARGFLPKPVIQPHVHDAGKTGSSSCIMIPGRALRANASLSASVLALLAQKAALHSDDGCDILLTLESGQEMNDDRLAKFIAPLMKASEIVVADGLLFNVLRSLLPSSVKVRPLGQALLENPRVLAGLKPTDFYMIETRAYNANRREFVAGYDALRQETGCSMNLDLQRVATPTGAASMQHREGLATIISVEEQVKWLLEGRTAERIVVESLDDHEAFAKYAKLPVVHLAEVAKP
jgi:ferredoxin